MASEFSFDVVSEIDQQELFNALDQARREILGRFDFKDSHIEIKQDKDQLTILAPNEFKITAVIEIIKTKLIRRNLDVRILGELKIEPATGGTSRAIIPWIAGISQETAKIINKLIRDNFPKVKSSVQGDAIRVISKSKDELQAIMNLLNTSSTLTLPLQFTNYR